MAAFFVVTLLVSLGLTPVVRRWAIARGWVDLPGEERRVHTTPVPRLGGLAIFAAFATGVLLTFVFPLLRQGNEVSRVLLMLAGGAIITVLMAVDDVKRLKPVPRLLWQFAVAALVVVPSMIWPGGRNPSDPPGNIVHYDQGAGVLANNVQNPFGGIVELPLFLAAFLTILWIVGTTNAINWIDGLDGLAASVSAVACVVLFVVTGPVLGQWTLAYLPLIFWAPPSWVFYLITSTPRGSSWAISGAMFLGFTLAVLSVIGGAKVAAALLVLGVPILDGVYMIIYRLSRGRSPLSADRGHLHHRLLDIGFSQGQVVLIYVALCGAFGVLGLLPARLDSFLGISLKDISLSILKLGGLVVMVIVLVCIFAYISRRQFDRQGKKT